MKVYRFNPDTGSRDRHPIDNVQLASWAGQSVEWQVDHEIIEPISYVAPQFGGRTEVTVHVDAGITGKDGEDISYRHDTEWRCFCLGQFDHNHCWDWVVLPPSSAVRRAS